MKVIKIILDKNKNDNLEMLNALYLKLINDNKIEIPLIKIVSYDLSEEITFRLPLELHAFIAGLEFSDHMMYENTKE